MRSYYLPIVGALCIFVGDAASASAGFRIGNVVSAEAGISIGRRLDVDPVCAAAVKIARDKDDNLLHDMINSTGESNLDVVDQAASMISDGCSEAFEGGNEEMNQCTFYVEMGRIIGDTIFEEAWLFIYGNETEQQQACGLVVNAVNNALEDENDDLLEGLMLGDDGMIKAECTAIVNPKLCSAISDRWHQCVYSGSECEGVQSGAVVIGHLGGEAVARRLVTGMLGSMASGILGTVISLNIAGVCRSFEHMR